MALVVPDLGEIELLRLMLIAALTSDEPFLLHLYKNDYEPNKQSLLEDFEEADFDDYFVQQLDRENWQGPNGVDGVAVSFYGVTYVVWTTTGVDQQVYGYYVTDMSETVCLWAERFVDEVIISPTNPILLQPVMRLHSEVEPEPPPPP